MDPVKPESIPCPWPRQEQWGIRVFHERWQGLFKENQELGIGKKTKWQPTEAQFFPSDGYMDHVDMEGTEAEVGAGFQELMRVLKVVENVAMGRETKDESKAADMTMNGMSGLKSYYQNTPSNAKVSSLINSFASLLD
jgi:hypothetical protein